MSQDDADMGTRLSNSQIKRNPTSLNLDETLWDTIKILAIKEKRTATEIVEESLRNYIAKERSRN